MAGQHGYRSDYRHPVGRFCLGDPGDWYNGFSWQERSATSPAQRLAVKEGRVALPTACGLTGFSRTDDPKGLGYIFMHNEDYNRPLVFHPLCRSAHYALHSRFTDPLRWLKLARKHYRHGAWFTFLTMDPEDMRRPFQTVYPIGLPDEGELWTDVADELHLQAEDFPESFAEAQQMGCEIACNVVPLRGVFRVED